MTQAELMALPEWPSGFGQRQIVRNGQRIIIPVAPPLVVFQDSCFYIDREGSAWMVGTHNGVKYRRLHWSGAWNLPADIERITK